MYFIKINAPSCFYVFLGATLRGAGDLAAIKEGARFGSEEDGRRVSGSGGRQADNPRDRGWRLGAGRRRAQPDLASQCALGVPRRCPGRVNSRGGRAEGRREASWTPAAASVSGCGDAPPPLTAPPPGVSHSCGLSPGSHWTRPAAFRKPPDGPGCTPHPDIRAGGGGTQRSPPLIPTSGALDPEPKAGFRPSPGGPAGLRPCLRQVTSLGLRGPTDFPPGRSDSPCPGRCPVAWPPPAPPGLRARPAPAAHRPLPSFPALLPRPEPPRSPSPSSRATPSPAPRHALLLTQASEKPPAPCDLPGQRGTVPRVAGRRARPPRGSARSPSLPWEAGSVRPEPARLCAPAGSPGRGHVTTPRRKC